MPRKKPVQWSNEELVHKLEQAKPFNEPIVQEFLDKTEEMLFEKWKDAADNRIREEIWLQCQGIQAFRKFVEDTIALGVMAQAELNKKYERESNLKGSQR